MLDVDLDDPVRHGLPRLLLPTDLTFYPSRPWLSHPKATICLVRDDDLELARQLSPHLVGDRDLDGMDGNLAKPFRRRHATRAASGSRLKCRVP
jgi:hypothetical protein